MKFDHRAIEAKWQKYWMVNKTFKCEVDTSKPKYYILDMFPYVSGSGLHVGHVEGYTATDILARHRRQRGYNVLHPMGWDSFGLPTEQHAIRTGTHPAVTTEKNIDTFRKQLQAVGFSYDWDREIATSDKDYYKWTQWIFTKLYEKGLAYEAKMPVNFCPALGTVLSNEEVENGKSIEGGHAVERRPLRQWVLKITEYAERLIDDLEIVDWPDSLKRLQRNWIGKSVGAKVSFPLKNGEHVLSVFTTRPDTLFGATYMVLAPEHPFVAEITTPEQKASILEYQKLTARKSDLDRTDLNKDKSGVFTGGYAINPVNGKEIPVWISDYVIMSYGTGAIMAVPAHDERDFEFANKFSLPIVPVYTFDVKGCPEAVPEGMSVEDLQRELAEGTRCWPGEGTVVHSANDEVSFNGMNVEEAKEAIIDWLDKKGYGEKAISYKLRDWLFSRQRYWGEPFPILHFEDGSKRVLDLDELPLCPPEVKDFSPSGDGNSPLAKVPEWVRVIDSKTKRPANRETNTMPQWAGSCWYYLRFCDPQNTNEAWSQEAENYWMPVDVYVGGVEHAVLHLLYARFWHKVLYDCGLVKNREPFHMLRNQGLIVSRSFQNSKNAYLYPDQVKEKEGEYFDVKSGEKVRSQIEKMSKSKLNGVTPDDIIEEFGADALRMYEMFMGPLDKEKIWNTDAVSGCRRFLNRFYDLATSEKLTDDELEEATRLGHRLVFGVSEDIEKMQFNTAIAKMMEFVNEMNKLDVYPRSILKMATQALSPFAPHLAEEVWEILGCQGDLSYYPYPEVDEKYLQDEMITYVVQVNGKLRGRFDFPKDQTEEVILRAAKEHQGITKYTVGKEIMKVIFVPNKLLNLVVR